MEYYSQYGQDRFVDEYVFGQSTGALFVDIDARNGVLLSNTLAFEKFKGSKFEILQSMDFQRFGAVCYSIEENGHFMQMRRFLRPRGYRLVEKIGQDRVFKQEQKAASMPRVGFLKPGAFRVRGAQALARRLRRVVSR